jgi:hypothetical protein
MCLDFVDVFPKTLKKEHGQYVGWKIYRRSFISGELNPQFEGFPQKVGLWINEKPHRTTSSMSILFSNHELNQRYKTGFHIYLNKTEAEDKVYHPDECLRKVYFRKPVAFGTQATRKVIVAKELRIIRVRMSRKKKRRSR